jgi:hypothetical protein
MALVASVLLLIYYCKALYEIVYNDVFERTVYQGIYYFHHIVSVTQKGERKIN